jgi:hypothetical protein
MEASIKRMLAEAQIAMALDPLDVRSHAAVGYAIAMQATSNGQKLCR